MMTDFPLASPSSFIGPLKVDAWAWPSGAVAISIAVVPADLPISASRSRLVMANSGLSLIPGPSCNAPIPSRSEPEVWSALIIKRAAWDEDTVFGLFPRRQSAQADIERVR